MTDVIRELTEVYRPQAELKGLSLKLLESERVPVIQSDANRIRQILGNLVSNAIKYTEQGYVTVRLRVHGPGPSTPIPCVCVEVSDSGPGIPEAQRPLIFKEFTRLDPNAAEGSGLGLAISQRIAEALRGWITLESEEGRGSTFTLCLPWSTEIEPDLLDRRPAPLDDWPSRTDS
jgi:signal transduction histidine kinase